MTTDPYTASSATPHTSAVGDELKGDAARLKDTIEGRARQEAEGIKGQASDAASSASSALNKAAEELQADADAPDWLAAAMKQAAGKIDTMANQIQGGDLGQIGQNVADFARKSPGAFLAASAAAGFAAARVLRAGVDRSHDDQASETQTSDRSGGLGANSSGGDAQPGGLRRDDGAATGGLAATVGRDIGGVAP